MAKPVEAGISHLRVTLSETAYVGPGRADLLEGIAETGSIAEAAKRMGMSYRRAWSLVQALNEGFGEPLIETSRGGSGQGGATLTPAGAEVLAGYRRIQLLADDAIAHEMKRLRQLVRR